MTVKQPLIITVDGPAGSGKSTVSRILARKLGLPYLNSGAIYRAVTLAVIDAGVSFDDRPRVAEVISRFSLRSVEEADRTRFFIGDREVTDRLKDPDITAQVYRIADESGYRKLLVDLQRRSVQRHGVVAEGRDMGTVIFPDASIKFYLDAPAEERARRQHLELVSRGVPSRYEEVLLKLKERDHRDLSRTDAPLLAAPDAVRLNSGGLTIDEVVGRFLDHIQKQCGSP
ncbi:MAG: (d)CMP kinase [Planctomycetes bacterium]|nr:(d)CMP kinase [Planctomycetota bacterium]